MPFRAAPLPFFCSCSNGLSDSSRCPRVDYRGTTAHLINPAGRNPVSGTNRSGLASSPVLSLEIAFRNQKNSAHRALAPGTVASPGPAAGHAGIPQSLLMLNGTFPKRAGTEFSPLAPRSRAAVDLAVPPANRGRASTSSGQRFAVSRTHSKS